MGGKKLHLVKLFFCTGEEPYITQKEAVCISLYNVSVKQLRTYKLAWAYIGVYIHITSELWYVLLDLITAGGFCVMEVEYIGLTFRRGDLRPPSGEHLASLSSCPCLVLQNQRVYSSYFSKKTREGQPETTMLGGVTLIFAIFRQSKIERGKCTLPHHCKIVQDLKKK